MYLETLNFCGLSYLIIKLDQIRYANTVLKNCLRQESLSPNNVIL